MLSIVILNWNGAKMMRKYLPSVVKNSVCSPTLGEIEVVVADNASTDDSLEMLGKEFPEVRTIVLEKNWGFADGYNKAFEALEKENKEKGVDLPDYYLLLNSDVRVEEGWLEPMLDYMLCHPDVAVCQPKLLSDVSPKDFEYAGAAGGFIDKYGYPYCRGRIFNTVEEDKGQYDDMKSADSSTPSETASLPCLWATGACLLIRREDYWLAGGLDGRFFAHNEEIDLCWRLNLMGRKAVCVPKSKAYHLGGGTLPKGNPRKTFLNFRNNLTMLYKNLPDEELNHVMRMRFWLDWLAAFQMLILGHSWGDFKAVLQARNEFKAWKHNFDADRKRIQSTKKFDNIPGKTNFSILWQYYAKGKKTFGELGLLATGKM